MAPLILQSPLDDRCKVAFEDKLSATSLVIIALASSFLFVLNRVCLNCYVDFSHKYFFFLELLTRATALTSLSTDVMYRRQ